MVVFNVESEAELTLVQVHNVAVGELVLLEELKDDWVVFDVELDKFDCAEDEHEDSNLDSEDAAHTSVHRLPALQLECGQGLTKRINSFQTLIGDKIEPPLSLILA